MLHNIVAVVGPFGSGKTLRATELGIHYANKFRKPLVVNFDVDVAALRKYSRARYGSNSWMAGPGLVRQIEVMDNIDNLFKYHGSVVVFDEAGVFTNSRAWKDTTKFFLKNLFQIRHLDIHMFVVFQFVSQIDKQLRSVIQHWVKCKTFGYYDTNLKLPKIFFRMSYHYGPEKFWRLEEDTKARGNFFLPWFWASYVFWRLFWINDVIAKSRSILSELNYALRVVLQLPYSRPRVYRSIESMLFSVFDSAALVGDLGSSPSLASLPRQVSYGTSDYSDIPPGVAVHHPERSDRRWAA